MPTLEELMSIEGQKTLIEAVWEKSKGDIEKQVSYTVQNELVAGAHSQTRQVMAKKMDKLIDDIIQSKSEEVHKAVEVHATRLVARAKERFEIAFHHMVERAMYGTITPAMEHLGKDLLEAMSKSITETFDEESRTRKSKPADMSWPGHCPRCGRAYRFEEEVKAKLCAVCIRDIFDSGLVKETPIQEKPEDKKP